MRRNRLSVRARTTVGQKLPDDWEEKVVNFREFVSRRKVELGIQADRIFNMDEVPMSFDAPHSRTRSRRNGCLGREGLATKTSVFLRQNIASDLRQFQRAH